MFFISCATICARGCSMFQFAAPFNKFAPSGAFLLGIMRVSRVLTFELTIKLVEIFLCYYWID